MGAATLIDMGHCSQQLSAKSRVSHSYSFWQLCCVTSSLPVNICWLRTPLPVDSWRTRSYSSPMSFTFVHVTCAMCTHANPFHHPFWLLNCVCWMASWMVSFWSACSCTPLCCLKAWTARQLCVLCVQTHVISYTLHIQTTKSYAIYCWQTIFLVAENLSVASQSCSIGSRSGDCTSKQVMEGGARAYLADWCFFGLVFWYQQCQISVVKRGLSRKVNLLVFTSPSIFQLSPMVMKSR